MLPGARHFVGELHGLVLGGDLDRLTAGRLRRPACDLDPADLLAFGAGLLRRLLAAHPVALEVIEVGTQTAVGEVAERRVGAEVAVHALDHGLVAGERRALETLSRSRSAIQPRGRLRAWPAARRYRGARLRPPARAGSCRVASPRPLASGARASGGVRCLPAR